jgi:hypothetical protein
MPLTGFSLGLVVDAQIVRFLLGQALAQDRKCMYYWYQERRTQYGKKEEHYTTL